MKNTIDANESQALIIRLKLYELKELALVLTTKPRQEGLMVCGKSLNIQNFINSLNLSKAWVAKYVSENASKSPYQNDGIGDIGPTTEATTNLELEEFDKIMESDEMEKINFLREENQKIIDLIKKLLSPGHNFTYSQLALINCYTHACEAKFWLGFELQHICETS